MENHFKAVAFDFSGVIHINESGNILGLVAEALGVPIEKLREVYFEHNHLSNVKNMKWFDMFLEVVMEFDKTKEAEARVREVVRVFITKGKVNTELLSFLPKLRILGFKTAIFSNNTSEFRETLEAMGVVGMVDEIVISGEIGFQKPHKEAFDVLFEKLGVKPQEVIFVDDSAKSLGKASEIGYFPIRFKDNEQLRDEFKKIGIFV